MTGLARGALAVGEVVLVQDAHGFRHAVVQVAGVHLPVEIASDVDRPEVFLGVALVDPLRQRPADAGGARDADRVHAAAHEEVLDAGRLADHEGVVRSEAFRDIGKVPDLRRLQVREALQAALHERVELLPVLGDLGELEVPGDALHAPGLGHGLEPAEEQRPVFGLEIGAAVEVAHAGEDLLQPLDRLGDDVHVLGRVKRHAHVDHAADLPAPDAGAVDHDLAGDVALVGGHPADGPALHLDAGHRGVFVDLGAPHACALDQGARGFEGIGLAVVWEVKNGHQPLGAHARDHVLGFLQADLVHLDPEGAGHGRTAQPFAPPVLGLADAQRPGRDVAGRHPGLGLERRIELSGVLGEVGHLAVLPQLRHQAGGRPGGAAADLLALQEHDVGVADLGQMVGGAAANDAAADDDDPGLRGKLTHESSCWGWDGRTEMGSIEMSFMFRTRWSLIE